MIKMIQKSWQQQSGWSSPDESLAEPQLVLIFGASAVLRDPAVLTAVRGDFPGALIFGCSTAGEIHGAHVRDDSLILTAIHFEKTRLRLASVPVTSALDSLQAGRDLAAQLVAPDLVHLLVLSDGLSINGSDLVRGLRESLPPKVSVTGGMAADGTLFAATLVCADDDPRQGCVAALGFYSHDLVVGYGSQGGWDAFGPRRRVTRSNGNVLYEVDGQSALCLYKHYLGEYAADLPASALLFPLEIDLQTGEYGLVRTVVNINESEQSMTFAGDIPLGASVHLMKANFDRLIGGAEDAANASRRSFGRLPVELALFISCFGRKLILKQRVEEEVEAAYAVLGEQTVVTGFYSYGEISPFVPNGRCELHNQTMTVTTFSER